MQRRQTTSTNVRAIFEQVILTRPKAPPLARRQIRDEDVQAVQDGLYIISVAARMLRMHPQTLRKYERAGLVRPSRTVGMLRLYSEYDIAKLRMIKHLVEELRLNLAGVELAMAVFDRLAAARESVRGQQGPAPRALDAAFQDIAALLQGNLG